MNDKGKIVAGLVIFLVMGDLPLLYNLGKAAPAPEVVLTETAKPAGACVLPKAEIKTEHMQLLDVWRDTVVREGQRIYVNAEGKKFDMSLSNTCLDCHSNKKEFCDRCHTYASVDPLLLRLPYRRSEGE